MLLSKLEAFVGSAAQAASRANSSSGSGNTPKSADSSNRSYTPPGLGGGKITDNKIKISQSEIDFGDGQKPKVIAMSFMDDGKKKVTILSWRSQLAASVHKRNSNSPNKQTQLTLCTLCS